MARRKKLPKTPDYVGTAPNQQVQKANPLKSLSETDLTLSDLKILDAYLSRINSHDPEKRYVRFSKGELEKMLGVQRIRQDSLEKRLKNLFQVVTIQDKRKPKGFKLVALFELAEAVQDDDGLWQVDLACTESAMEYVFNIDNLGYFRYRLRNIIDLTSRYSYILYLYFEDNKFRKSWEISIDELRIMLNCTADTYNQYKRFNDLVLKKCHKEINEKTSIKYSYEPCQKKGRKYTAIKFEVETLSDYELPVEEVVEELTDADADAANDRDRICLGFSNQIFAEFTDEELEILKDIAWLKKSEEDYQAHMENLDNPNMAYECAVSDYLRRVIALAKRKKPKKLFLYVKKMIENS